MVESLLGEAGAKTIGAENDQSLVNIVRAVGALRCGVKRMHEVGHYFGLDDARLEELMEQ